MSISVQEFEKALASLELALREPFSDIVRDAATQRFEFTFELAWKTARKKLGTTATAPRVIIREMAQQGWVDSPEEWFGYLEDRNLTVHSYNEPVADRVFESAKRFAGAAHELLERMKNAP